MSLQPINADFQTNNSTEIIKYIPDEIIYQFTKHNNKLSSNSRQPFFSCN